MNKKEYIRKMYAILVPMCAKNGYFNVAAGMIAQSIQEGWNSGLATKYHNYWGMKAGKSYKGKTVAMNNKAGNDPAVYRVFSSMEDGCQGYFDFLAYPRYAQLKQCKTDKEYLNRIGPCGWNSNPGYGARCISHLKEVYDAIGTTSETQNASNNKINTPVKPYVRYGETNEYVLAWQKYLNTCGFDLVENSRFDDAMLYAVKKYQQQRGLVPDGIIGPLTWATVGK
jgi:hypothetical protein